MVLAASLGSGYPMQQQSTNKPAAPRISPQTIIGDQTAVTTAQSDLTKATAAEAAIAEKHRAVVEQGQDWQDAQAGLTKAQKALEAAKIQVAANLAQNPDYLAAIAAKQKAVSDLQTARASGDAGPDVLGPLDSAALDADAKVNKMEEDTMTNDPAIVAAKANIATARQPLDDLEAQFEKTLPSFQDWNSAHSTVVTAQKHLADAQTKLATDSE